MRRWFSAMALLSACAQMPIVSEGEHVSVRSDVAWCAETTDYYDETIVAIGAWLGLAEPELPHVTVNRFSTSRAAISACDGEFAACSVGHDIYLGDADVIPHELVHAIAWRLGNAPDWLEEGLAQVLEGGFDRYMRVEPDVAVLRRIFDSDAFRSGDQETSYTQAASFVRYLIEELGREEVVLMYHELEDGAGQDGLARYLERRGGSLDALLAGWEAAGPEDWHYIQQPLSGCAASPIVGGPLRLRPSASPTSSPLRAARAARSLPFSASGAYSLEIDAGDCAGGVQAALRECGRGTPPYYTSLVVARRAHARLVLDAPAAMTFWVEIASQEPLVDFECGTACSVSASVEPLARADDLCASVRVPVVRDEVVQLASPPHYVVLEGDEPMSLEVWYDSAWYRTGVAAEVCVLAAPCAIEEAPCFAVDDTHRVIPVGANVARLYIRNVNEAIQIAVREPAAPP